MLIIPSLLQRQQKSCWTTSAQNRFCLQKHQRESLDVSHTTSSVLLKTQSSYFTLCDLVLSSTDPSWRGKKISMWLLLRNTPTPSCLSAASMLSDDMTRPDPLNKGYYSKPIIFTPWLLVGRSRSIAVHNTLVILSPR